MPDMDTVVKGMEMCVSQYECSPDNCPYYIRPNNESGLCWDRLMTDALSLLKEQEPREITKDEWESWKKDKYRDPLCMYWRGDITPFWILRPEEVHEPAYLIGDIKIFNGKPDKEKMHRIWLK